MQDRSPETVIPAASHSAPPESASELCPGESDLACYFRSLGPGLMAGLSDNDPSGVATYAIAGAVAGYSQLWLLVVATFMVQAIQVTSARLGDVTQQGLLRVTEQRFGRSLAMVVAVVALVANQATLIADVAALGAAAELLTGIAWQWFVVPATLLLLLGTVFCNFRWLRRLFLAIGLLFLAFVVAAFLARPNWGHVLQATVSPTIPSSLVGLAAAMALLGTTISPYLVVWQAEGEREVHRTPHQFKLAVVDITVGYVGSNLLSFFIIVTTASTLFVHHRTIQTAADVSIALRPFAGHLAGVIFAIGLLGAALTAIPMFAISSGFIVSEVLGWPAGLSRSIGEAPKFYAVLAVAFLSGAVAAVIGVDPIVMLFDSQILSGVLMPILIAILAWLVNDRRVMGAQRSSPYYNFWLAISFLIMAGGTVLLIQGLV